MNIEERNEINIAWILICLVFFFLNVFFSMIFWFTFQFGGTQAVGSQKLNFLIAGALINIAPGIISTLILSLLSLPKNKKITAIIASLFPPMLFIVLNFIRILIF